MIPLFIVNFNRLHSPREMVQYLSDVDGIEVVIVDNNSDYPPLLDWYGQSQCRVIRLGENFGHNVVWEQDILSGFDIGDGYIVTDPDLDLGGVPKDFLSVLREGLRRHPEMLKCGLSLEIRDIPKDCSIATREAIGWEKMCWRQVSPGYCRAHVDTTFAFYNNTQPYDKHRCIRTDRPYTARHRPWYYRANSLPDDERYYLGSITRKFNHFSTRLKRELCPT